MDDQIIKNLLFAQDLIRQEMIKQQSIYTESALRVIDKQISIALYLYKIEGEQCGKLPLLNDIKINGELDA